MFPGLFVDAAGHFRAAALALHVRISASRTGFMWHGCLLSALYLGTKCGWHAACNHVGPLALCGLMAKSFQEHATL